MQQDERTQLADIIIFDDNVSESEHLINAAQSYLSYEVGRYC